MLTLTPRLPSPLGRMLRVIVESKRNKLKAKLYNLCLFFNTRRLQLAGDPSDPSKEEQSSAGQNRLALIPSFEPVRLEWAGLEGERARGEPSSAGSRDLASNLLQSSLHAGYA